MGSGSVSRHENFKCKSRLLLLWVTSLATFTTASTSGLGRALPSNTSLSVLEAAMVDEILALRASANTAALCVNSLLLAAARDTVERAIKCQQHTVSQKLCDGSEPEDRLRASGYPIVPGLYSGLIGYALGCRKDDHACGVKAVKLWRESESSKATLSGRQWLQVGVAGAKDDEGEFYFAAFVGGVPGPWCDVQATTTQGATGPVKEGGEVEQPPHLRLRQ